ncbi:MAG: threonine synthase [Clostridiales bacterium]|nr:threonine synthase [Clostridiales bacterium]
MYISTRSGERLTSSQAILKGLSSDGGLFLPESISKLNFSDNYYGKSYREIAKDVFTIFLDDFTQEEIDFAINSAYDKINFREKFVDLKHFDGVSFLELYHGPTLAFKDMALTILPFLIDVSKKKNGVDKKSLILVATSGDTGGAALSSFIKSGKFDTVVLYPDGGVSEIQEKQMLYYTDDRTKAFAVKGNFDDCQTFVKEIFSRYNQKDVLLSSANSINIGRLIPQVIYYVYSYCQMVKCGRLKAGEKFNVCVPTGNFGDIFAGFLAREIGVPIEKFICASNKNNVLADFFATGLYDKNREFYKSNSPAMDILVSSNLERLVYLACNKDGSKVAKYMNDLKTTGKYQISDSERAFLKDFEGGYSTEEETIKAIGKCYRELNYLIDPHTAVAYDVYNKLEKNGLKTLIVSTASPYKFPFTVAKSLSLTEKESEVELIKDISSYTGVSIPYGIKKLMYSKKPTILKTKEQIESIVNYENLKVEISVPCSTANLGVAFDGAGIALGLYNTFGFEMAEEDSLVGFGTKGFETNLVLRAYKKLFEVANREYVPVKITLKKCTVPSSSGLGSSATCIVAGVMAANYMLKNIFTKEQLLSVMTKIEGHPDNLAPALMGGLTFSYVDGENVVTRKVEINKNLKFYAVIPSANLSTKSAREILPETYDIKDVVHNLSRALNLEHAFKTGNVCLIKDVFDDKIHQPYRLPLIKGGKEMKALLEENGFAVAISGAGPTLLAVGYKAGIEKLISKEVGGIKWKIKNLKVSDKGAILR